MNTLSQSLAAIPILFVVIMYSYYAYTILYRNSKMRRIRKEWEDAEEKFFTSLLEGLKKGAILDKDDISHLYEVAMPDTTIEIDSHYTIASLLKKFIVSLYGNNDTSTINYIPSLKIFLKEFENVAPYAELPNAEKTILTDLHAFIEKDNRTDALRKISELSMIIRTRDNDITRIQKSNRRSYALAVLGSALTIVFGFISVYLAINK